MALEKMINLAARDQNGCFLCECICAQFDEAQCASACVAQGAVSLSGAVGDNGCPVCTCQSQDKDQNQGQDQDHCAFDDCTSLCGSSPAEIERDPSTGCISLCKCQSTQEAGNVVCPNSTCKELCSGTVVEEYRDKVYNCSYSCQCQGDANRQCPASDCSGGICGNLSVSE